jgi:hypothetical protein
MKVNRLQKQQFWQLLARKTQLRNDLVSLHMIHDLDIHGDR